MLFAGVENVKAHTIVVPSHMYFHLWQQNTYINFASTTSLDNIIQTNDKLYLNQYWFSVENANLTISNFFTNNELIFTVNASSQNTSTTKVYVDDKGEPTSVYVINGTANWSYDTSTKTLTFEVTNFSLVEIVVSWGIPGDVNRDGRVDASDLFDLSQAYGSNPSKPNWSPNCDFNKDLKVDASDLFDLSKNYGKTTP